MIRKAMKIVFLLLVALFLLYWAILIVAIPFNARTPSETDLSKSLLLAQPPAPLAKEVTLKIVTFNIHGLYAVSKHRPERVRGIAQVLGPRPGHRRFTGSVGREGSADHPGRPHGNAPEISPVLPKRSSRQRQVHPQRLPNCRSILSSLHEERKMVQAVSRRLVGRQRRRPCPH